MFPAARDLFLTDSANSAFKWTLFNARLAEMGSGAYRPGCDFGRVFDRQFWGGLDLNFRPRFWGSSVRGFACIWVFFGFGVLARTPF
jgi:hypothetical protein